MVEPRQLTEEERNRLAHQNTQLVSKFHREKLEHEAMRNWDKFYKRNETRFFKDRRWTTKEFGDILEGGELPRLGNRIVTHLSTHHQAQLKKGFEHTDLYINQIKIQFLFFFLDAFEGCETATMEQGSKPILLEVGCGVGNFLMPLLEDPNCRFYCIGCDFSPRAINLVKSNPLYDESRCKAFVADAADPSNQIKAGLGDDVMVDVASLIFVLSAIHPDKMTSALRNIHQVLLILFNLHIKYPKP